MITTKLTELIERDWEEIAARVIVAVRRHPDLEHLSKRSDLDLREWCREILEHLGSLMSARKADVVRKRFEILGRIKCEEHIPLHEAVLRLQILKNQIVSFVHEHGVATTALQVYAEEELEQRMDRFFDECIYHMVRGYERATQLEQHVTAAWGERSAAIPAGRAPGRGGSR
jgi:hypothetical protein